MALVSINGNFNHNSVSVTDRGFLFGESVYEVLLIKNLRPFQLQKHLRRLDNNFYYLFNQRLNLNNITQWVEEYLHAHTHSSCSNLYIQVTSGAMPIRNHVSTSINPTCIIHQTYAEPIELEKYERGFKAITIQDTLKSLKPKDQSSCP